ncbi:hypothetical protein [Sinorhizobium meliloti]|uniref:hypothetical protein n=1 Tax=Rhizobium meliloti TaxID=382 RepID=UPI000FDA6EA8|nr:hypothetical protein [Sinorhizobium meliloti]RVE84021.1 hypothetical protein CN238_25255 [Sinorhizobium meliloti]RVH28533.1 hypothetical protein CN214_17520 [Sinorhizobium meliloti]
MTTLTKQLWDALCKIANPSTVIDLQDHEIADKLQEIACTALCSAPAPAPEASVRALDWSNFEGPKRNVEWRPDEQDLIYTAINYRDDEYGDQDEDAGQQIVERLLAAWRTAVISEQLTFEISARLLKEGDEARATLAVTPAHATDVVGVIAAFEAAYPELYYHIAKGTICAGEPLYGAIITTMGTTEVGHGESNISADDALRIAIENAGLTMPARDTTEGSAE